MHKLILNVGSINIDHVYQVDHFVRPGETMATRSLSTGLGGKGANQSVAIARAGGDVLHFGQLGQGDAWASAILADSGVDIAAVNNVEQPSGHAIIQVDSRGENAIILHGGANQNCHAADLETLLRDRGQAIETVLLQNETNLVGQAIELAIELNKKIVLNPAPMTESILDLPLEKLDTLIVNEIEAQQLASQADLEGALEFLVDRCPDTKIILTLGAKGLQFLWGDQRFDLPAVAADVVDTTCAGDTFVGYYLAGRQRGLDDVDALKQAARAAAITVSRLGAIDAIPQLHEVLNQNA